MTMLISAKLRAPAFQDANRGRGEHVIHARLQGRRHTAKLTID